MSQGKTIRSLNPKTIRGPKVGTTAASAGYAWDSARQGAKCKKKFHEERGY